MPLLSPTADCTTGWRTPGWCGVEPPFIEIAETVSQWPNDFSLEIIPKLLYGLNFTISLSQQFIQQFLKSSSEPDLNDEMRYLVAVLRRR
jgi:hypothetical protein